MIIRKGIAALCYQLYFGILFFLAIVSLLCSGSSVWANTVEGSLFVSIQDDRLTVRATDTPLEKVLQEIARKVGIRLHSEPYVANEKIKVEFKDLTIEEGIGRILARYNYIYMLPAEETIGDTSSNRTVIEVWLFSRREDVPGHLMREASEVSDPKERMAALKTLVEGDEEKVMPTIISALRDGDPQVREVALEMLEEADEPVPIEPLVKVALTDSSSQIRMNALELLVDTDEKAALEPLKQALRDPDPQISNLAQELLEDVEGF